MAELHTPKQRNSETSTSLPLHACSPLNRCNLPAVILGSYTYQQHPVPLEIDGVNVLHRELFDALGALEEASERILHFRQYMCSAFLLGKREEAGFSKANRGVRRDKSDYLRLLRGWLFNADGVEAAVMKRWVESRFGLLALNHKGCLNDVSTPTYEAYHADYVRGLYNSNALEAQLDLLYSYCQYELTRQWPDRTHWRLYRGVNHMVEHSSMGQHSANQPKLVFNNLNSFSVDRHLCESFGDVILEVEVPTTKLLFFPELLDGVLKGESEFLVLGGVYQATIVR